MSEAKVYDLEDRTFEFAKAVRVFCSEIEKRCCEF